MTTDSVTTYTIQEVSKRSGLSIPTLRYYEEMGLIPLVSRDSSSGHRRYSPEIMQLIESLANLRTVGMSLEEMRAYLILRDQGDESAQERRDMFKLHAKAIDDQIAQLKTRKRYLAFKVAYWDARLRGNIAEAERIAEEYESIVSALR